MLGSLGNIVKPCKKNPQEPSMMIYLFNPSTWDVEAREARELKVSLGEFEVPLGFQEMLNPETTKSKHSKQTRTIKTQKRADD